MSSFFSTKTEGCIRLSKRKYRLLITIALILSIIALVITCYFTIFRKLPDELRLSINKNESFNLGIPVEGELNTDTISVVGKTKTNIPEGALSLDFADEVVLNANTIGNYELDLKLFGLFTLKTVELNVVETPQVIAGGSLIGLIIETDGVMVLGTGTITGKDGKTYEPADNILKSGDYIVNINGVDVNEKELLIDEIQKCGGDNIRLTVRRNEKETELLVYPILASDGTYKIGAWIRDDTQGIGTLTYISSAGRMAALGHGITDVDTGLLIETAGGSSYTADIVSITKGVAGTPGELSGVIHKDSLSKLGSLDSNTRQGIYGNADISCSNTCDILGIDEKSFIDIAFKQEIKVGPAQILSSVGGEVECYDIEIERVDMSSNNHSKGMVIHITDPELLEITGGIVQGMSGSPILQSGKIIGAVTHVLVKDPTRGYGIFIENMLEH